MAGVVVVYGPPHAGKTGVVLRLVDLLAERGLRVGGFYQRGTSDEFERRGYDLVRFADRDEAVALARPAMARDREADVCSFVFHPDAIAAGLAWVRDDAAWADVLVIDEVSKLEVGGAGHCEAVRCALALPDSTTVVLSVRADQLPQAVEVFDLADRLRGYVELPATDEQLAALAQSLAEGPWRERR